MIGSILPFGGSDDEDDLEDFDDVVDEEAAESIGKGIDDVDDLNKRLVATEYIDNRRSEAFVGNQWTRTMFTSGWPDEPNEQFLNNVINKPGINNDISFHIDPQDDQQAIRELNKIVNDLKTQTSVNNDVLQMSTQREKLQQAQAMLETLRGSDTSLFDVSMYTTVRSESKDQLPILSETLQTELETAPALTDQTTAVYAQLDALKSVSPVANDVLGNSGDLQTKQRMMGGAVSCLLPFTSRTHIEHSGVEFGIQGANGSPVILDRWGLGNGYNQLTVGTIGAGKSFATKLNILRTYAAYDDVILFMLDPLQGYSNIVDHLGGEHVYVGGENALNPLEIKAPDNPDKMENEDADPYAQKLETVMTFFRTFLQQEWGDVEQELQAISKAVHQAYRDQGITSDATTHDNESPTIRDVQHILIDRANNPEDYAQSNSEKEIDSIENRASLAVSKLQHFNEGREYSNLARNTDIDIDNEDVVYLDLAQQEGSGDMGLMMTLLFEQVYQRAKETDKKVMFVLDEARYMMKDADSLDFLEQAIRHSRHYDLSVNFVTQTAEEFLVNDQAETIADNCVIKLFFKTEGLSTEAGRVLGLNDPAINYVRTAREGDQERGFSEALLGIDGDFMPIQVWPRTDLEAQLVEQSAEEILSQMQ